MKHVQKNLIEPQKTKWVGYLLIKENCASPAGGDPEEDVKK